MSKTVADLEAEREFLLRSLDDLELEREAGNVDDDTYRLLHDDYTARAAAVIRSLRDGTPVVEAQPTNKASRRLRLLTYFAIAVFAVAAAVLLTKAVGTRGANDTITGNAQSDEQSLQALADAAKQQPDSYVAQVNYARATLAIDPAASIRAFGAAEQIDPTQPEPPTYIGWISSLAAQQLEPGPNRDVLVQRALTSFDKAIALDRTYYDPYVFRAITKFKVLGDAAGAIPDFQLFLANAPADHPMRSMVENSLAQAIGATTTSVAPSSSTTP
jgi:tetratricopeptide (TPR) repeat protein